MMSFLQNILAFIVVIGILVTVHEFGHYWVAKRLGVKILRFSIGFGQPLWSRRFGQDQTEFVVAAIPLGGYVKMLDETEQEGEPIDAKDLPRAFNRQPLKTRAAVVVAGPLFNFIFAIIAYTFMYMSGITGMKALVGEVAPNGLADQAGLVSGYQIVAVAGHSTPRWDSVVQTTLQQLLDGQQQIIYSINDARGYEYNKTLDLQTLTVDDVAKGEFFDRLGFKPLRPTVPAIVGRVSPGSAAERDGLLPGDRIILLDNQPISDWNRWADYIAQHPHQPVVAEIERHGHSVTLTLVPDEIEGRGRMGVYAVSEYKIPDEFLITESHHLGMALVKSFEKTWEISVLTLKVMAKMLVLQVSPSNISGPISIAQFAGQSAQNGWIAFLSFLGLVSISLGIVNLLPIPVLDGGHLLLYFIEWIKGGKVTEMTERLLQQIGFVLILGLMGLAIFNDLERLFQ
jgi:regulator of sigma E protease